MHGFKRRSSRSTKLEHTGNFTIDSALERHQQLETSAKNVAETVKSYMTQVREAASRSSTMALGFQSFFIGSPAEERTRVFAEAHDKADRAIPDKLLDVAKVHILEPLDAYMQRLGEVRTEIAAFTTKQSDVDHYTKKVAKLDEEKRKRESEGKVEKAKQIEKHTRNHKKLNEAKAARDEQAAALLNRLNYMHETRNETMDPIFTHVFQFQQELFRQSADALSVELPPPSTQYAASINTTAPVAPGSTPGSAASIYQYDAAGNRLPSPSTAGSTAPQTAQGYPPAGPDPRSAATAPAQHYSSAAARAAPPAAPHAGAPTATYGAAPTTNGATGFNAGKPGAGPPAGLQPASSPGQHSNAGEDELVNKWFAV